MIEPTLPSERIILLTSCVNATMGPARGAPDQRQLPDVLAKLFERAGYQVVAANRGGDLCCGLPFESHGFPAEAERIGNRLSAQLTTLSQTGHNLIVSDTSPCTLRMKRSLGSLVEMMDVSTALATLVLPRLAIRRRAASVALHVTCSVRRLGLEDVLVRLAEACAEQVILPTEIECCGFAGDKGFSMPELNASALRHLSEQLPPTCTRGYSTSRTCEIGLSQHSGVHYQSIAYLLDWCSAESVA